jgi:hypothetical protein
MAHKSSSPGSLSRRDWLKLTSAGVIGYSMSGWLGRLAQAAGGNPKRRRSCILLWMNGGPSQIDTFDPKPGHANGGEFSAIPTAVPGIRISEHLPRLAASMRDLAIIRSMNSREADHGRGTYLLHTGYLPGGPVNYPTLGSLLSHGIGQAGAALPNFVSIAPFTFFSPAAYGPGFLGPRHAPLVLGTQQANFLGAQQQPTEAERDARIAESLRVPDLETPGGVGAGRAAARVRLLDEMEQDFEGTHPVLPEQSNPAQSHRSAYQRAVTLMNSSARRAFDLDQEPATLRDRYGRNLFGQGCLLARRLVERGVPFVEVSLGALDGQNLGWDTHIDNFPTVRKLSGILDAGWATLMDDLRDRGLLDNTLIVWMGEFGRTPRVSSTGGGGREHWASAWSTVLAGGGIRGGQVYGQTSTGGDTIESDRPTSVPDFLATIMRALGIDHTTTNMSDVGRPIRIVDTLGRPIQEVLA